MFYLRLIISAIRSLDANFLRSILATLGVLIGVSSVVACMSIMEGFSNNLMRQFKSLGSNLLYVMPQSTLVGGRQRALAQTLTLDDCEAIKRELGGELAAIAPQATGSATIKRFQKSDTFPVIATSDAYFDVHAFDAASGRVFTTDDARDESSSVCCLGDRVAERLFGGMEPVGQSVKINSVPYRVVGVMEEKGSLGFLNADEVVYIPIAAGLKRFLNRRWLDSITVAAEDPNRLEAIEKKLVLQLRTLHGTAKAGKPDDFRVTNQESSLENFKQIMLYFRVVFYSIAGISLVVGGIGIMNIMLVSVTERTREIGVRMAVGARRWDILVQFLVESLIISLFGGAFGLLLGAMFADLLGKVIEGFFKTEITAGIIWTALLTSVLVGVFSGVYPAWKASRQNPVDALRYE